MSKIVVTGATGHIGNVLVKALIEKGEAVIVIILPNEDMTPLDDLKLDVRYGDITDRDFVFSVIEEGDTVYHLAGVIDIANIPYEKIKKVNVGGTKNIVDACIEKKAKRLIYTSSVHIIDPVEGKVLTEPSTFDSSNLVGNYAKTKALATGYIMEKAKSGELDAVVVYPSGVIGPCDYKISELGQVILDYMNEKLFAYVKGGYNFVDVRDVVNGIILAGEKGESGEGYILSGRYVTLKEMLTILNKKLKRKKLPYKIALWFVKLMVPFANLYYKVRNKKPVFSAYSLYTLNSNSNFSNQKAKEKLGYTVRNVEETLFDTVDWFRENKPELVIKKVK